MAIGHRAAYPGLSRPYTDTGNPEGKGRENVKQTLSGICAAVLLAAVLFGNAFVTVYFFPEAAETGTAVTEQTPLPVLAYGRVVESAAQAGERSVTVEELEADLVRIREEGYTTVTLRQIEAYVTGEGPLPDRPILLTFDDGDDSVYTLAYPLLQEYGMTAVVSVIGKYVDLSSGSPGGGYGSLSWEQLRRMQDSGVFEVASHTYDLHREEGRKGVRQLPGESDAEYRQMLASDLGTLSREMEQELGAAPAAFSYPFGAFSASTDPILCGLGFRILLSGEEKENLLAPGMCPNGEPVRLWRFARSGGTESEAVFARWERAG